MNAARRLTHSHTPRLRLIHMSDNERRDTPTDIAPPMGESRDTTPPPEGEALAAETFLREQRIPGAPNLPSTFKELAEKELVVLYRTALGMHESLLGASGLLEQNRRNTVEDIARVVDRGFDRVWERIAPRLRNQDEQIASLKLEVERIRGRMDADKADYERKFAEQQTSLDAINQLLPELERSLREAEDRAAGARADVATKPTS